MKLINNNNSYLIECQPENEEKFVRFLEENKLKFAKNEEGFWVSKTGFPYQQFREFQRLILRWNRPKSTWEGYPEEDCEEYQ